MFAVPDVVRRKAAVAGAPEWVERLPGMVAELADEWGCTPGRPLDGATESFVLDVKLHDGTPAVLKLLVPRDQQVVANEITLLSLAGGEGCPRLLRHDVSRGALLMERLGRSLFDLGVPILRRHEILAAAAGRLWRPTPDCGLPTAVEKGRWLIDFIAETWETLGRPCSARAVEYALDCALRRIAAHDDERAVLVHGDVHQWNALQSGDGFKLVDPDGLLAEPEYDLGIIMREDPAELLDGDPFDRAARLASLSGLDAAAIWEWGVVERVSTGLVCTQIGLQPVGADMLRAADVIARDRKRDREE
jgi:streptomycin 6-kinase